MPTATNKAQNSLVAMLNIMAQRELRRGWPPGWERLGRTDRDFVGNISELIDNVVAELKNCSGRATITIEIGGNWNTGRLDLSTAWLRVRDNATGMPLDMLEKCLALGEMASDLSTGLHEHGMGMKSALICLCENASSLKHVVTKRAEESFGYRFSYSDPDHPFGEIPVTKDTEIFAENERGTEFFIQGLANTGIYRQRSHFGQFFIQPLGFKYARVLSGDNMQRHQLQIIVRLCDETGKLLDSKAEWDIAPIMQRYRNGARPYIDQLSLSGSGADDDNPIPWSAHLDFGRAAQEAEYIAAGLPAPTQKHPCHAYQRKIHVVMHGRIVTSLNIDAFGGQIDSNVWVPYTGVLTLLSGFKTTHQKDGVVSDGNWQEVTRAVYDRIKPLIHSWAAEERQNTLSERDIRNEYARRLRLPPPNSDKQPQAKTEFPVTSSGGFIDILYFSDVDDELGTVIEMKPDEAIGLDVFQAYYYVFMCDKANKTYGRLIAKSFTDGAQETAREIKKRHDVTIELRTLKDEALDNIVASA